MNYNEDLLTISDGKLYNSNEMVRVGCHDCEGCSDCCQGMGDTILLDPYDCNRLCKELGQSFESLMQKGAIELHVEEGLILPNLKMTDAGKCYYLNENGRCSIHSSRPGICRLFPLGRQYTEDSLSYFLLKDQCSVSNRTKVKVEKWLATPRLKDYETYLIAWHNLTKKFRQELAESDDESYCKQTSMLFLQLFFQKPYGEDFYQEFYQRKSLLV